MPDRKQSILKPRLETTLRPSSSGITRLFFFSLPVDSNCSLGSPAHHGWRYALLEKRALSRCDWNRQLRELMRVASASTIPTSNRVIPTIAQASQFGIRMENHFTAPTARKATPRTPMMTPAKAIATIRSALLTNRSALLTKPPKVRRSTSMISLSIKVGFSCSDNVIRLVACF